MWAEQPGVGSDIHASTLRPGDAILNGLCCVYHATGKGIKGLAKCPSGLCLSRCLGAGGKWLGAWLEWGAGSPQMDAGLSPTTLPSLLQMCCCVSPLAPHSTGI